MSREVDMPNRTTRRPMVVESARDLRGRYARCCEEYKENGPEVFVRKLCEQLGLIDAKGRTFTDPRTGWIALNPERKLEAASVSPLALTHAVLGPDWANTLGLDTQGDSFLSGAFLREATAPAIGPSALANVTAWKAGIAGLLQAALLEAYDDPQYVLADLAGVMPMTPGTPPTQRLIGVVPSAQPAPTFDPAQGHPAFRLDDIFVGTSTPKLKGGKILINKLTAFHDITGGQITATAAKLGDAIRMAEELDFIHLLVGLLNNFSMGFTADASATAYNSYNETAVDFASYFYVNSHVNNPTDYRNIGLALDLFANMKHPIKQTPIVVNPQNLTAICPLPSMEAALKECNAPTTMRRFDNQGAAGTKQPGVGYMGPQPNPYGGTIGKIVTSPWLRFVLGRTSATPSDSNPYGGSGLTEGTTAMRWYLGDYNRAIKKRVGWGVSSQNIAPNSHLAADYLVDFGLIVDAYYHFQVVSPWHMIQNKQA